MSITKIINHVEQAQNRLIAQYRDKPRIKGMVGAIAGGKQTLEDALFAMLLERSVNSAIGAQLDVIGNIVGQPRDGMSDEAYRVAIWGKIGVNISTGTPENLISLFCLLMKCTKAHYIPYYPAECEIMGNFAPIDTEQLLIDGNMELDNVNEWTAVNGAVLTKQTGGEQYGGDRCMRIEYNGTDNPGAKQKILAVGEWYWLRGRMKGDGIAAHLPAIYSGTTLIDVFSQYNHWYDFDAIFQATSQDLILGSDLSEIGWVEFDSCGCRRLLISDIQAIYEQCLKVIPVGVKLAGIGWYNGDGHDSVWDGDIEDPLDPDDPDNPDDPTANKFFAFEDDPEGEGFGDVDDPTAGGKLAELFGI